MSVIGQDPITWIRIQVSTGKLEIYPDCDLLRSLGSGDPEFEPAARGGTVLAICSMLMRVHVTGVELTDITASTLGHHLARHMLAHYCHVRPPDGEPGPGSGDHRSRHRDHRRRPGSGA